MRPVLGRAQMRSFDGSWIERGIPGLVLMENAGRGAAHLIGLRIRPRASGEAPRTGRSVAGSCVRCADERALSGSVVVVLTGGGNNAGDGFVVARHLSARGANVRVLGLVGPDELAGDARIACDAMQGVGVPWEKLEATGDLDLVLDQADIIVDALLGTGATRPITGMLLEVVRRVNQSRTPVIALDLPSGLDADTGAVLGAAIVATHTVTFAHLKRGLLTTAGQAHGGTITVSHIGVPGTWPLEQQPAAWLLEESDVRERFVRRSPVAHKGTAGRVVLIAGSPGTVGAARLASRASLRAGAGLVTLASDPLTVSKFEEEAVEVMTHPLGDRARDAALFAAADALVIGPGLGPDSSTVIELALSQRLPTVMDADALRWLAGPSSGAFTRLSPELCVLTPHPGEAAALLNTDVAHVEADRFGAAERIAKERQAVVVLKGSRTVIAAPDEVSVVSVFGSPVLATAGSGDVLSGILGALLVGARTRTEVFHRAQTAVAVHGIAGERWAAEHGDRGLLASEIAELVPLVLAGLALDSSS